MGIEWALKMLQWVPLFQTDLLLPPTNHPPHFSSSTSSRPRLSPSVMCGTAGRAMRVERAPLKRGERVPGPLNPSPALPAIPVLHPGLEHLRPPPCTGASRGATGASQVSNGEHSSKEVSGNDGSL